MKIIARNQANDYKNGENCFGYEFNLGTKELDGAIVNVNDRFPVEGRAVNEVCREIAYAISGSGQIVIEGKPFDIKSEDLIVIDKGERFYWNGNFKLFVYCSPAWYPGQHKNVE